MRQDAVGDQQNPPPGLPLRRYDLVCEELDGEAVVFDPQCGGVHRFNAATLLVWELCDGAHTATAIADAVAARYAIDPNDARVYIERVVEQFRERGLVDQSWPQVSNVASSSAAQGQTADSEDTARQATGTDQCSPALRPAQPRGPTRREVLGGGVAKLVFVAPVISSFCAARAYANASNPIHPGSPTGLGGCKNVGYSCVWSSDCCDGVGDNRCIDNVCCVRPGKSGCVFDEDCCDFPTDTCNAGTCF